MSRRRHRFLPLLFALLAATLGLAVAPASAAAAPTATFTVVSDWGTGFEGKVTVTNGGTSTLSGWTVEFDLPAGHSITSSWNAQRSGDGRHYVFRNPGWASSLAPGASASFGFNGSPGGLTGIQNCTLNGNPCDGGSGEPGDPGDPGDPGTTVDGRGAPYLYLGWGNPPSPATVMNATGVRWFTMAFVLSSGGCNPAWDGIRPLLGGVDAQAIAQIRAAGGDIVPSFGGWSGNKLGPNCATAEALAAAYQQVIDAYDLKAIDIDIENTDEFENEVVQDRILNALKIVERNNPGIETIITFGTTTTGPNWWGNRLIERAHALDAGIDVFTIMPFNFGGSDMYASTVSAAEGLKAKLAATFGWSESTAYAHVGISGMNGLSDQREVTDVSTWTRIRDWASSHGIGRLAFWSVNRDRGCAGGGVAAHCSGIAQPDWEFTRITAGF